jgi:DNA-binding XRE family transcriptional regulator
MEVNMLTSPVTHPLGDLRQARGLAIYGLATLAKCNPTTISAIERWRYHPRSDTCRRIAAALGVEVADIWPEQEGEA